MNSSLFKSLPKNISEGREIFIFGTVSAVFKVPPIESTALKKTSKVFCTLLNPADIFLNPGI